MRLSEWRKTAPTKESMSDRVLAVVRPVLMDLGAEADAECWVAWGDDAEYRYSILAPTVAGLISVVVRIGGPEEGPRATARLIRWPKVAVTELGIEASDGHRVVAVQVESLVLKGVDGEADRICEFVRGLIASIDDRNPQTVPLAVVQGVSAGVAAVAASAAPDAAGATRTPARVTPKRVTAESKPPARPKASAAAAPKAVPAVPKATSKRAAKPAATPAASGSEPGALVLFTPPAAEEASAPPTPIAARAAAAQHGDKPGARTGRPGKNQPESEPEQPAWVEPHLIEESPAREPNKPRPWTP